MPAPRPFATAANRIAAANGPANWRVLVTVCGIAVYLGAFYWIDHRRCLLLGMLLVPEELVNSWVENDWTRFGLLDHFPVLAGAALIWLVSGLTGWLVLNGLAGADQFLDRLEQVLFSLATGLSLWSLLTLVLGMFGCLQDRRLFAVMALAVCVAAVLRFLRLSGSLPIRDPTGDVHPTLPPTRFGQWALLLCVPLTIMIVLGGTLPATHFDVREYHLQVPKEWFQQGRVTFLPHNVYGNMPLGAEMHAVLGMVLSSGKDDWWWGALIGKSVIAAFGPLGAAGVYVIGRRFCSGDAGAWGAFAFLSTPWIGHVSMTGLIDGVVACYTVLAVGMMLIGLSSMQQDAIKSRGKWGLIALSGFLAGSAVACKYPAPVFLVAPWGFS